MGNECGAECKIGAYRDEDGMMCMMCSAELREIENGD